MSLILMVTIQWKKMLMSKVVRVIVLLEDNDGIKVLNPVDINKDDVEQLQDFLDEVEL